jgi:hypothetical protein
MTKKMAAKDGKEFQNLNGWGVTLFDVHKLHKIFPYQDDKGLRIDIFVSKPRA